MPNASFRRVCTTAVLSMAVMLATSAVARATTIVPGNLAAVEGNSNNGFPFNIAAFSISDMRWQQVYAASEFSGPLLITDIEFRPDAQSGNAFASTLNNVRLDLSTTSKAVNGLSTTFANNVGGDDVTVFSGALSLSSAFTGPAAGPKAFDITIHLTTPFLYDPANGNLLLDVRNFLGGSTAQFDADTTGVAASRLFGGVNSATGGADSSALVTQFDGAPSAVPEPMSLALFGSGIAMLAARRRRNARR